MINDSFSKVKTITVHGVITRADGSIEDLGIIGFHSNSPIRQMLWNLRKRLARFLRKGK